MLGKKLLRKRATLQDIYRLYQVVIRTPKLLAVLRSLDCAAITSNIIDPMDEVLSVSKYMKVVNCNCKL